MVGIPINNAQFVDQQNAWRQNLWWIDTTNLLLQDDLISQTAKDRLWKQGQRKTAFLVGFIERMEGNLPCDIKHALD
jgi:hypothetical protein